MNHNYEIKLQIMVVLMVYTRSRSTEIINDVPPWVVYVSFLFCGKLMCTLQLPFYDCKDAFCAKLCAFSFGGGAGTKAFFKTTYS